MRLVVATVAEYASVRENLLQVVHGGISQVQSADFPFQFPFWLALSFLANSGESEDINEFTIELEGPTGDRTDRVDFRKTGSDVASQDGYWSLAIQMSVFSAKAPGHYRLVLSHDGEELFKLPLAILKTEVAKAPPQVSGSPV